MKKVIAIILALVIALSASSLAFAAEDVAAAPAATEATSSIFSVVGGILEDIVAAFNGTSILDTIKSIIIQIQDLIANFASTSDVAGAIADLEAKIGSFNIAKDIFDYVTNLINTLKQKIKDLYSGNRETEVIEETEAVASSDTGSSATLGIAAFAAVSAASAAAFVCLKKKND